MAVTELQPADVVARRALHRMDSRSRDAVGELIDDRYKLLRLMGEGGMGRVYEAEHIGIGKQVALKILHAVFSNTADVVMRFRQEARIATQIGNAHIVDVTDSGATEDGRFYFVMEHLDGLELTTVIQSGAVEIGRALHITRQIAEALAAAHDQGVIHRDLKPENILLIERDGDPDFVKVLDFGIALTVDSDQPKRRLTQPGLAMGTPEYIAPEQALALTADARSDIYSLGAILYELLTGAQPYRADTFTQVLVLKSTTEPRPPRDLREDLPEQIEQIVLKAMARRPEDRHQSMTELAYEVTKCLEGRDVAVSRLIGLGPGLAGPAPLVVAPPTSPINRRQSHTPPVAETNAFPHLSGTTADVPATEEVSVVDILQFEEPRRPRHDARDEIDEVEPGPASPRDQPRGVTGRTWFLFVVLLGVAGAAYWYLHTWLPAEEEAAAAGQLVGKRSEAVPAPVAPADAAPVPPPARLDPFDASVPAAVPAVVDASPPAASVPDGGTVETAKAGPAVDADTSSKPGSKPVPTGPAATSAKQARMLIARAAEESTLKRWDAARELYGRVSRGRHLRDAASLGLARVELAAGNGALAVKHAEASLEMGGGAPARHVLARALAAAGRRPAAIKQYRLLIKQQPRNRELRRELDTLLRRPKRRSR